MPNKEAAAITVKLIEEHRDAFNMSGWASGLSYGAEGDDRPTSYKIEGDEIVNAHCGTTFCGAGFGSIATGHTVKVDPVSQALNAYDANGAVMSPYTDGDGFHYTDWFEHGAEVFGIESREANMLFVSSEEVALAAFKAIAAGEENWFDAVEHAYFHEGY